MRDHLQDGPVCCVYSPTRTELTRSVLLQGSVVCTHLLLSDSLTTPFNKEPSVSCNSFLYLWLINHLMDQRAADLSCDKQNDPKTRQMFTNVNGQVMNEF